MEVPRSLKHLVQKVMRGFYTIESVIVVDLLIRKHLIKEDEMLDLLKFERKHLRAILAQLKNDKLIRIKLRVETGIDGKAQRHNYYYINYKAFVNVVKYKLDHMRKKIELEERDLTSRASFVCDDCHNTFTDLEVHQLFDINSGELRCSFCGGEVKEDPNHMPKADSRLLLAKFNQMMEPLWLLLKDVEDIRLTSDLLEPDIDIKLESGKHSAANSSDNPFSDKQWKDSDRYRNINSEYQNSVFNDQQNFSVKIEDKSNTSDGKVPAEDKKVIKKEQPAWMSESTVSNNINDSLYSLPIKETKKHLSSKITSLPFNSDNEPSKEILETLLIHEKQDNANTASHLLISTIKVENDDNIAAEDEIMSEEDEEMEVNIPMVKIGGQYIPLSDINDEAISQMNDEERDEYVRLTQQVYAHMYD